MHKRMSKSFISNDLRLFGKYVLNNEISKNRLIEEGYIRNVLSKYQPNMYFCRLLLIGFLQGSIRL